ncbi:MAG: D-amino-acid transaminase [Hyphomicrobiaceae bacterium]|nr:D-amino-acid transaminase [Hyphomicrobiaceae bacterium]
MTRVVYVNGHYEPYAEAGVHAEDRGFQFGDAVYEVVEVKDGHLVDEPRHMGRLERSLKELRIPEPMTLKAWSRVLRETVRRNRVRDGLVYLQVSRGARPRDFLFPGPGVRPTVVCLARSTQRGRIDAQAEAGIGVITRPDNRWGRCDIKTVMLLPAAMAKEAAKAEGAKEAWFVDADGYITEGASSNAWIVDKDGRLVTRKADADILPGITRMAVLDLIAKEGLELVVRPFTVAEAKAAREAFVTSATNHVMPVVRIDGASVGNGAPGLLTMKLRASYYSATEISSD